MGLFRRLRDLTMSNINALIDQAEDPVKMTDQYLRDMEEDIGDAEAAVARQIAVAKGLEQQLKQTEEAAEKRSKQAETAVLKGDDELAKELLTEKKRLEQKAAELRPQVEQSQAQTATLREQLDEMREQYQELKRKRDTLVARAEAAKAQKQIAEAFSGFSSDGATRGFDRMEEKVRRMEAEAEARTVVDKEKGLDERVAALETDSVDDELAALKKRLGKA